MMKNVFYLSISFVCLVIYLTFRIMSVQSGLLNSSVSVAPNNYKFNDLVVQIIHRKQEILKEYLNQESIKAEFIKYLQQSSKQEARQIKIIDQQWVQGLAEEFIHQILNRPMSQVLIKFQSMHSGYDEIFITDQQGVIIALTNKTSDYLQSDEKWWQIALVDESGYGSVEQDLSSFSEGIPIFFSMKMNEFTIIIKALININSIKSEF